MCKVGVVEGKHRKFYAFKTSIQKFSFNCFLLQEKVALNVVLLITLLKTALEIQPMHSSIQNTYSKMATPSTGEMIIQGWSRHCWRILLLHPFV